jgi:hypothetical protein
MSQLLSAPSPLDGSTICTQQWVVRVYELPFEPSETFIAKLKDGDKDVDVRIHGILHSTCNIDVAMGFMQGSDIDLAWLKFERELDELVTSIQEALEFHERLLMTKPYFAQVNGDDDNT